MHLRALPDLGKLVCELRITGNSTSCGGRGSVTTSPTRRWVSLAVASSRLGLHGLKVARALQDHCLILLHLI